MQRLAIAVYGMGTVIAAGVALFDASRMRDLSNTGLLHPDLTSGFWSDWVTALVVLAVLPAAVAVWHLRSSSLPGTLLVRWFVLAGPLVWAGGAALAMLPRTYEDDGWFTYAPNAGVLVDGGARVDAPGALALACVGLCMSVVALVARRGDRPAAHPA